MWTRISRSLTVKLILVLAAGVLLAALIVVTITVPLAVGLSGLATGEGLSQADFLPALNRAVLASAALAALSAFSLGVALIWWITSPIRRLQLAIHDLSVGTRPAEVDSDPVDELGELARVLKRMAGREPEVELAGLNTVANVARELRAPLSAIEKRISGLTNGTAVAEPDQVGPLRTELQRLSRFAADLEVLAVAEAGKMSIERRPLTLLDVVSQVLTGVEPSAVAKGVYLSIEHSGNLPIIAADGERLRQVFHSLLDNAVRHTPPGGSIQVSLKLRDADFVQASITDSGSGVPPHHLDHVFDQTYWAKAGDGRLWADSCLGLSLSRHIVTAHGGQIWAESPVKQGQGVRIVFTLPLAESGWGKRSAVS